MSIEMDFSRFIQKAQRISQAITSAVEETSAKAAEEILEKAIEYASGPMNPEWKQRQARTAKLETAKQRPKRVTQRFKNDAEYQWYREVMHEGKQDAPWPVSVNTNHFRTAHKREKLGRGVWRVYGDSQVANYFKCVHNGTIYLKPRPTIGKAVQEFKESGRVREIAREKIRTKLREVGK